MRKEVFPRYVSAYNNAPFSFYCSYLVARPETETEETGEQTAYDQEAIQAAAGCEESSYPTGKSKGNNKTQRCLLFTQHHLSCKASLLFYTVLDSIHTFHLTANTLEFTCLEKDIFEALANKTWLLEVTVKPFGFQFLPDNVFSK